MKSKSFLLLTFIIGFIISCEKDNESNTFSFTGKAQKGPFVTGTSVTINELNNRLGQTGKTFTSTIISDDGIFELNDIELSSNMALLTANGYYFEELYGKLSPATLSLQSISDLSEKETFNINILTHIIKARIESLFSEGLAYHEAKEQAESEFLDFLGVHEAYNHNFDDLDISQNEESNAMLLAFSVIVQRYTNAEFERPSLTAELTQLMTHLGTDFKDNGQINDPSLIDTLLYNISQLNLIDIRNNIERRYSELGLTTLIPEFENYIGNFQVAHKDEIHKGICPCSDLSPITSLPFFDRPPVTRHLPSSTSRAFRFEWPLLCFSYPSSLPVSIQTLRAAGRNPAEVLKYE